jgi:hypothetical protein
MKVLKFLSRGLGFVFLGPRAGHLVQGGQAFRDSDVRHADFPQNFQLVFLLLNRFKNDAGIHWESCNEDGEG